ncbi:BAH domain-containing protein [Mycena kentingensis (nom. inval.)]|nr:BAH domain-containing protein [Mycena kentingensis (nom. inval.)]
MSARPRRACASPASASASIRSHSQAPSTSTIERKRKSASTTTNKHHKPPSKAKRKAEETAADGGDPEAPSAEEWETMQRFGSFVVSDDDGQQHTFHVGDSAAVLPAGTVPGTKIPPHEYWLVKVKAIRARPQPSDKKKAKRRKVDAEDSSLDVWVRIDWYYSPSDAADEVKAFDPSHCSIYERLLSNHSELISALTFEGTVRVHRFYETLLDQPPIAHDDFFRRYFFNFHKKEIWVYVPQGTTPSATTTTRRISKAAAIPVGCICDGPYDIRDKNPMRVMHMCTNSGCARFFHRDCLLENGWWQALDTVVGEGETRLSTHVEEGDDRSEIEVHGLVACASDREPEDAPTPPPPQGSYPTPSPSPLFSPGATTATLTPPPSLIRLANLPIVRGAYITAQVRGVGMVGTGHVVVAAKRFLAAGGSWEGWENAVGLDDAEIEELCAVAEPYVVKPATGEEVVLVCPGCRGRV